MWFKILVFGFLSIRRTILESPHQSRLCKSNCISCHYHLLQLSVRLSMRVEFAVFSTPWLFWRLIFWFGNQCTLIMEHSFSSHCIARALMILPTTSFLPLSLNPSLCCKLFPLALFKQYLIYSKVRLDRSDWICVCKGHISGNYSHQLFHTFMKMGPRFHTLSDDSCALVLPTLQLINKWTLANYLSILSEELFAIYNTVH